MKIQVRHLGDDENDRSILDATPEQRLGLMWQLALDAWAFKGEPPGLLKGNPLMNPDFHDILSAFLDANVEFLLVGAYAVAAHGHPRATGDIDLWVRPSAGNATKVYQALKVFGAPLEGISKTELTEPDLVFQIGLAPRRIDLLTSISGVQFDEAYAQRIFVPVDGLSVPTISKSLLIKNKRATGRTQDLADAEKLESIA